MCTITVHTCTLWSGWITINYRTLIPATDIISHMSDYLIASEAYTLTCNQLYHRHVPQGGAKKNFFVITYTYKGNKLVPPPTLKHLLTPMSHTDVTY